MTTSWVLQRIPDSFSEKYILRQGETSVGRSTTNIIQCPHGSVSRNQCIINVKLCGCISVRDVGSSNGTFINNIKLLDKLEVVLNEGDIISLGVNDSTSVDPAGFYFKLCRVQPQNFDELETNSRSTASTTETANEKPVENGLPKLGETSFVNSAIIGTKRHAVVDISEYPTKLLKLTENVAVVSVEGSSGRGEVTSGMTNPAITNESNHITENLNRGQDTIMLSDSDEDYLISAIRNGLEDHEINKQVANITNDVNISVSNFIGSGEEVNIENRFGDDKINEQFENKINNASGSGRKSVKGSEEIQRNKSCASDIENEEIFEENENIIHRITAPEKSTKNSEEVVRVKSTDSNVENKQVNEERNEQSENMVTNTTASLSIRRSSDENVSFSVQKSDECTLVNKSSLYNSDLRTDIVQHIRTDCESLLKSSTCKNPVLDQSSNNDVEDVVEKTVTNENISDNADNLVNFEMHTDNEFGNKTIIKDEPDISANDYTLDEDIIIIDSDDEGMIQSQIFDAPVAPDENDAVEIAEQRSMEEDDYPIIVEDYDEDDIEADEWYQKLSQSQQRIDIKDDEIATGHLQKNEEVKESSVQNINDNASLNKDFENRSSIEEIESRKVNNDFEDSGSDIDNIDSGLRSSNLDMKKDKVSKETINKLLDNECLVNSSTTEENSDDFVADVSKQKQSKIVDKEVLLTNRSADNVEGRNKMGKKNTLLKEGVPRIEEIGKQNKINEITDQICDKVNQKKDSMTNSSDKSSSVTREKNVDALSFAEMLCKNLAKSLNRKSEVQQEKELNQIKEIDEIKKKTIPSRRTKSTDALPQRCRSNLKTKRETLTTTLSSETPSTSTKIFDVCNSNKNDSKSKSNNKKDAKERRREKLKELSNKKSQKISSESKKPKPSASRNVKLTVKNRSDFLLDDFTKEQNRCENNKPKGKLNNYKIPRRSSVDEIKKVEDSNVVEQSNYSNKTKARRKSLSDKKDTAKTDICPKIQSLKANGNILDTSKANRNILDASEPNCSILDTSKANRNILDTSEPNYNILDASKENHLKSILRYSNNDVILRNHEFAKNKKQVRFESEKNLVKVQFIEVLKNSLRRQVRKDAVPPPSSTINLHRQKFVPLENFNYFNETLYDICMWNTEWLEEQRKHPPNTPPPVYRNKIVFQVKDEFVSYSDYRRTIYPLMLYELWSNISKAWEMRRKDVFPLAINDTPQEFQIKIPTSTESRSLGQINCQILLNNNDFKNNSFPRFGDLVIAELSHNIDIVNNNMNKKCFTGSKNVFGYISSASPQKITQYKRNVRPDLMLKNPDASYVCHLVMIVKGHVISTLEPSRIGRILVVKNIIPDLRLFTALDKFPKSPLFKQILNPHANRPLTDCTVDLPELLSHENAPVLNSCQKKVVQVTAKMCLESSNNLHLIHGPPGTGKTQVIVSLIMQIWLNLYKRHNYPRILICAPSNAAIDEIVSRLVEIRHNLNGPKRFRLVRNGRSESAHPDVHCVTLDTLASREVKNNINTFENQEYRKVEIDNLTAKINSLSLTLDSLKENCQNYYTSEEKFQKEMETEIKLAEFIRRKNELINHTENKKIDQSTFKKMCSEMEMHYLEKANIVVTTLSSCYNTQMEKIFGDQKKQFTCCIIDEATQASEPETLIPLMLPVSNVVLVGDPQQLPATILSMFAKENGLGKSLFTRHQSWWHRNGISPDGNNILMHVLNKQYRMHPDIVHWPSKYFYKNMLLSDERLEYLRSSPLLPFVVLSHEYSQVMQGELNPFEAVIVETIVQSIRSSDECKGYNIGIITPYNRHRMVLKKKLDNLCEIGTIDSFQGRECDIIILSCVRTDGIGFMNDAQRLNVALTRAKVALIIVGNFQSLKKDEMWASLIKNATERRLLKKITSAISVSNQRQIFNLIKY